MPNFWRTGAPCILKIQWFPLSLLIFGQKSCFLGPTIFKIPQPNWYYYIDMSLCTMLPYFCPYLISTMYIWTDFDLSWAVNLQIIVLSFAKLVLCQISCGASSIVHESIVFSCLFPFLNGQKSIYCFKRQNAKGNLRQKSEFTLVASILRVL